MKINHIIIEGLHNAVKDEYWFEDINYLHGKNGAGKSTVLQAIQLGLLGYIPGSNKTKQGVFAHSNNHTLAVRLDLDNGVSIQRIWTRVKNSVSESINVTPKGYDIESLVADVELPLFNFDEFTHMTANTLKDWFISYLPKRTFETDWPLVLKDALTELPEGCLDERLIDESVSEIQNFNLSGVEEIRQANVYFKNLLSFYKKELDRKTATIQSLIHYDDYVEEFSAVDLLLKIQDLEKRIESIRLAKNNADRASKVIVEMKSIEGSEKALEEYEKIIANLQDSIDTTTSAITNIDIQYRTALVEYNSYDTIINSGGICTFTNSKCEKISELRDSYVKRKSELSNILKDLKSKLDSLNSSRSEASQKLNKVSSQLYTCKNDVSRYKRLSDELHSLNFDILEASKDESELLSKLQEYKDMYMKSLANERYNEMNSMILKDKYRIENTIECIKSWVKLTDVNGLQARGDYNPFDELSESINPVLSNLFNVSVRCRFYSDGKSNSFSFGVEKLADGTYVPYPMLSSGEKCLYMLSLYIGLLKYTKSPMKLILVDDLLDHLDDENFQAVLTLLLSFEDIQFIFAGVQSTSVNGLNIIEL